MHVSINLPQNSKKSWLEITWSSNQHLLERDVDVHHGDAVYHHGEDVPMKESMEAAEGLLSFAAVCVVPSKTNFRQVKVFSQLLKQCRSKIELGVKNFFVLQMSFNPTNTTNAP